MKQIISNNFYEAPQVEVIEVEVEKGFSNSDTSAEGWGEGGSH